MGSKKAAPTTGASNRSPANPLFQFNDHGDRLAGKLRPGNIASADDWDELLLPEIER